MKVGIVAPNIYSVPPARYGGEIMVWDLCEGLAKLGVEVHLFAIPGSRTPTGGYLHYIPRSNWDNYWIMEQHTLTCYRRLLTEELDLIHCWTHLQYMADWAFWRKDKRALSTPWGVPPTRPLNKYNLVAWSAFQRQAAIQMGFPETTKFVHGGCNTDYYTPSPDYAKDDYILWFSRWHPCKRPWIAMQVAKELGVNLVMSGSSSDSPDHAYYFEQYRPYADSPNIKVVTSPSHEEKRELFRRARALIFPSVQEAFGLIAVEAMACGCPLILSREGAFPEIVEQGVTGFLCEKMEEYKNAVRNIDRIDPRMCRRVAVERFSRDRTAEGYLKIYREVAEGLVF
ncbi:MAG: glycosyltransferase [Candidatus Bathyarchaeia archaeon]